MSHFLFKDRDGQTPLPIELQKGLKIKTVQTMGELDELEEANIARGLNWLAKQRSDPKKYEFWLKLHKRLFSDVWAWAGEIRKHEFDNPDFLMPHDIWPRLYQLEQDLTTWVEFQSFNPKEIAARFHVTIETIHPFANGNGRFGRIITNQICKYHSYPIPTWGNSLAKNPAKRRSAYIGGLNLARRTRDHLPLVDLMFS